MAAAQQVFSPESRAVLTNMLYFLPPVALAAAELTSLLFGASGPPEGVVREMVRQQLKSLGLEGLRRLVSESTTELLVFGLAIHSRMDPRSAAPRRAEATSKGRS